MLGEAALLLAIPPGYATAIWPAAGLALVGTVLYGRPALLGVFLGSFAVNLGFDGWQTVAVAVGIGAGASVQAAVAAAGLKRMGVRLRILEDAPDVLRLLLVGGPAACLINASVGVGALTLAGKLGGPEIGYSWFTWWVGDSIGVMIVAPILLVLGGARELLGRKLQVVVPLMVTLAAVITLFVVASGREAARLEAELRDHSLPAVSLLERELRGFRATLAATAGFVQVHGDPDPEAWQEFATPILDSHPGLAALDWAPILDADRARTRGLRLTEAQEDGTLRGAGVRDRYVAIAATAPQLGARSFRGYDLASDPAKLAAIERASQGNVSATEGLDLYRDASERTSILAFAPVRCGADVCGYVVGAYYVDALMAPVLRVAGPALHVSLVDVSAKRHTLFGGDLDLDRGLTRTVEFGGRTWEAHFAPVGGKVRGWTSYSVLLGGLLLACLLGAFLLVITGRTARVERLVSARTAEIQAAYAAVEALNQELYGAHDNTRRFVADLSHELRTPLHAILGFTSLMLDGRVGEPTPSHREYLEDVRTAGEHLGGLIEDSLDMGRIEAGRMKFSPTSFDVADAVREQLSPMRALFEEKQLRLRLELHPARVHLDRKRLGQVLYNLVSNAIKFTPRGGLITVSATVAAQRVTISVADTGPGIAPEQRARVFEPFVQLEEGKKPEYGGTGLGLALVRRIVEYQGGTVRLRGVEPHGAEFIAEFPADHDGQTQ